MKPTRAYMSFGAGVQSTAIALLAINRDPRLLAVTGGIVPELYIFADTGDEPQALYPHVQAMAKRIRASGAAFEIVRTPLGDLGAHIIRAATRGHRRAEQLPFFVFEKSKYKNAKAIKRHCTEHFKIAAIRKCATAWFGIHKGTPPDNSAVQLWLGLSADEQQRLKWGVVPGQRWATYFQPLAAMNWHRADCINYLHAQGVPAMRSACVFCPFHSMAEWRSIKACPADWEKALAVDDALATAHANGGAFGFKNPLFLNAQGVRLRDLDTSEPTEPQQRLFDNECSGVCGV